MKLFVDDIREAPDGWVLAKTISEAVNSLRNFGTNITHISLDHDISIEVDVGGISRPFPSPDTFKVVAYFIEELILAGYWEKEYPEITVHSANPVGRREIAAIFDRIGVPCVECPYSPARRAPSVTSQNAPG